MIFTITELEHHPIQFDVRYSPGEIPLDDLHQTGELAAEGSATLLRNTLGEIRIQGHLNVGLESSCDRCLEPAPFTVDSDFDLFYRPAPTRTQGEIHLEEGEVEISFYEGDGVRLEDALREHILLSQPMQCLCTDSCRGLCPQCGENLNLMTCSCAPEPKTTPWDALKNL